MIDADHDEINAEDPLVDRAIRLFSFLGRTQQLKSPAVVDLDAYRRDGAVHWLHDAPVHSALHTPLRGGTPEPSDAVLRIDRVRRLDPPVPTPELAPWLDGSVDDPRCEPELRSERYVDEIAEAADGGTATMQRRIELDEFPEVPAAFEQFLREWRAWADEDLRDEPARAFYGDLFSMYVNANGHPEDLELALGVGLLAWAPDEHPKVRRHLLTVAARIVFDDDTGRLSVLVDDNADGMRIELDMLDPRLVTNPQQVNAIRDSARSEQFHPLDRDRGGEYARRLVHLLSADAEYRDEDVPAPSAARPVAAFAPALLLRKRSRQGLVEIFERIVEQITAGGAVPDGIRPLIDPDHLPDAATGGSASAAGARGDGALVLVDDDPFLPLPVNDMQLRILRQVDSHAQTLIQGPPGTGKTHTAAVLISHLLAQGKRVLVTAQTDRALKEVRDKLPEPVRPLAVSVVGSGREDMSDLRVAVERIAATASEHDAEEAETTIAALLDAIDELRRRRAALHHRLLEAREREVRVHDIAGHRGTLAAITRERALRETSYGWIDEYVDGPAGDPPLGDDEVLAWRERLLDTALLADEPDAEKRLVDLARVVEPVQFADLCVAEKRAAAAAASFDHLRDHRAYLGIRRLDDAQRGALRERLSDLAGEIGSLSRRREQWVRDAVDDLRNDRQAVWAARRSELAQLIGQAAPVLSALGSATDVQVTGDSAALAPLATALLEHLEAGNKLKLTTDGAPKIGAFTARPVKNAVALFERVRVNGAAPTAAEHVRSFLTWLDGDRLLSALDRAWPAGVEIPPEDTLHERLQWHITELKLLDRILALADALQTEEQRLASLGLPRPEWNDLQDVESYRDLPAAAATADAAADAQHPLQALGGAIGDEARWTDAEPVLKRLLDAVHWRDHANYADAHARLRRLHQVRAEVQRRDELDGRLTAVAPRLADAVRSAPADPVWDDRLPILGEAWRWAVAGAWIADLAAVDVNALQQETNRIDDRIREHVQELSATRAWTHAVSPTRLSRSSRASLEQYASLVRRFGKTGGQYREQRRAEIRDAMDRCRPAVPVWVMPLYRIADQLRIEPAMFDVVIVDEASQAGLEATFLQYLAPKIVVIGDDRQVSPSAVGIDQQQLRDLGGQYLYDDQFKATWQDPQRSLFDEARMRFSGMLTLVEHRRCVPEIIGFSNRIAYEPDGVRLIPVRQFGADRLEPIRAVFVEEGYERGSTSSRINPPEVDAIVDQIEKCLTDPRYDGLTFGVISLLGTTQAKAIEKKLIERISPEEWRARDLRCGDAADFQGSERDVMFLSMVAAPQPGRRIQALIANQYVQRYNVAASRAKDQMWLFHSVRLEDLGNTEDMRFQLLDYCYGVQQRTGAADDDRAVITALPEDVPVTPFQSLFEQRVCNRLIDRGYTVIPQYPALGYSLDLVVVGAKTRLAVECDGDAWHGPDAYQRDMARQRELERCGWHFFRILESEFYLNPAKALAPLWDGLAELDIHPSGWTAPRVEPLPASTLAAPAERRVDQLPSPLVVVPVGGIGQKNASPADGPQSPEAEAPVAPQPAAAVSPADVATLEEATSDSLAAPATEVLAPYTAFSGSLQAVATATRSEIVNGILEIVAAEGPILGHRLHSVYVKASAGQRVGTQIAKALNSAVSTAVRQGRLVQDDPLGEAGVKPGTFRLPEQPPVIARELGPRTFDQIPPAELADVMHAVAQDVGWEDIASVYRETMARYGVRKMGSTVRARLQAVSVLARADR